MKELLTIKEKLKKFVGKNEVFIHPILKFLVTYIALGRLNGQMGYMEKLANPAITLVVALAGSFLPMNLTIVIIALFAVAHIYALSMECALIVLALFLVLFLLYFRFAAKDSVAVLITPIAFFLKIPYVIPVSMGLIGTPTSMVSIGCSVIVYQVLHFINVNSDKFVNVGEADDSKIAAFKDIIDGLIANKAMVVLAFAFATTVLIVYIIRRLSIKYSWTIAIVVGSLGCFFITLIGTAVTGADISLGGAFLGAIISIILNTILQYFCFDLDYNRVERVQFEDDEYYYYVKAVPKNTIRLSDNGKKRTSAPKAKPVRVQENNIMGESTGRETPARAAVRANAAKAASQRSANKGPLGMSGGRPAGEGRKKETNGKVD